MTKKYIIVKDDSVQNVLFDSYNDALAHLHKIQGQSWDYAMKHGGWSIIEAPPLSKKKDHAFNKDIYLIGENKDGIRYWLESPSWDCGWYWGFGYIETFTNNLCPSRSRDIDSHSHWDGFVGRIEYYDLETKSWAHSDWIHHINESPKLDRTVLTEEESWIISDLMQRFYAFRKVAEILHTGTAHLTSKGYKSKNDKFLDWINQDELPNIMRSVLNILRPEDADHTVIKM